jgi:hypothetical protein
MGSLTRVAAHEISRGDNAFYAKNLALVLQKVMQEDSSCWDAHRFLRELEVINPHVHRVKHDERNGRPEAIAWMLLEGREDLVRHGDVLFLDAMKRDHNRPRWPCIGPCIKDNENMVRVTAECICIAESHAMHQWILEAMEDMEPLFLLSNVRLVFADQLITDGLLVQLGIKETPTRRSVPSLEQSVSRHFWKQARLVVPLLADHDQRHSGGMGSCFPKCFQTLGRIPSAS